MSNDEAKIWSKLQGKWSGTVSPELGGYPQQYNFVSYDKVEVTVLTNTMTAEFRFDLKETPHTMDIIIRHPEQQGQAQIAPYIFNFLNGDEEMEMCCPYGELERPKQFNKKHGGYVVMSKKALDPDQPDEDKERIAKLSDDEKVVDYIQVCGIFKPLAVDTVCCAITKNPLFLISSFLSSCPP